ncbi:MAG: PaaI family thioesterase, partial [Woeseia sp.]
MNTAALQTHANQTPEAAAAGTGIQFLNRLLNESLPAPPFARTADIWPESFAVGRAVFVGHPSSRFYNPMGTVHGGWISALLDTAMASAVHTALGPDQGYSTIELKSVFVKPVREDSGRLRCEGVLLHLGKRVAHAEGKVYNAAGELVAYGTES